MLPNGWRYAPSGVLVGDRRGRHFDGTSFGPNKLPENAAHTHLFSAPWNDGSSFVTKETVAQKYTPNEQV